MRVVYKAKDVEGFGKGGTEGGRGLCSQSAQNLDKMPQKYKMTRSCPTALEAIVVWRRDVPGWIYN